MRPRVVIVGAGFGGLSTARGLARAPVDVTIVDRNNFHTFLPLLYQVATAGLNAADCPSITSSWRPGRWPASSACLAPRSTASRCTRCATRRACATTCSPASRPRPATLD